MTKSVKILSLAIAAVASLAQANAAVVTWTDWSSTSSGTLNFPSGNVGVSLASSPAPVALIPGTLYYAGFPAYGTMTPSDLIQVNSASSFTLSFDIPVVNPYIALFSVGAGNSVTYSFDQPFTVESAGTGYWGYGGYTVSNNGMDLNGQEFSGVLKFTGTFSSLSFTTNPDEFWHGFNVGAVSAVPEPSTYFAGISALGMLCLLGKRNRK